MCTSKFPWGLFTRSSRVFVVYTHEKQYTVSPWRDPLDLTQSLSPHSMKCLLATSSRENPPNIFLEMSLPIFRESVYALASLYCCLQNIHYCRQKASPSENNAFAYNTHRIRESCFQLLPYGRYFVLRFFFKLQQYHLWLFSR